MCVPLHDKCIFHIQSYTDNFLVQIIPLIKNISALLVLEHLLYLICGSAGFFFKGKYIFIGMDLCGHLFNS